MKIKAPFIFDPEGVCPDRLLAFTLGWLGWKYYFSYPYSRCKCGMLCQDDCCHKCTHCNCERGS